MILFFKQSLSTFKKIPCVLLISLFLGLSMGQAEERDSGDSVLKKDTNAPPRFNPDQPSSNNASDKNQKPPPIDKHQHRENMQVINQFLDMPPERIAMLRAMLKRIENMSPQEREAMRTRIRKYKGMNDEKWDKTVRAFKRIPPEKRRLLRKHWKSLSPEAMQAEKEKLKHLSPQERRQYHKDLIEKIKQSEAEREPDDLPKNRNMPNHLSSKQDRERANHDE